MTGRRRLMAVLWCLPLMPALAACAVTSREARFTGSVTPAGHCGETSQATMTVQGKSFAFTPTDGVILLRGEVGPDGAAHAALATAGADRKPFTMTFSAKISGDHVDGSYVTPRCTFSVSLNRVRPGLF